MMHGNKPTLETNRTDIVASAARGIAGACPVIGGIVAEAIDYIIPRQKFDRVIEFLKILDQNISELDDKISNLEKNLSKEDGIDLLEEGIVQASRAISEERRNRLANLLSKSLSQEKLKYNESKKLLNLLRELTDPELLWLAFYSKPPTIGSKYHTRLMEKYPDVLQPASRTIGVSQEEIDRGALQDSYKNTLVRLGLLEQRDSSYNLTSLGHLLIRYIEKDNNDE